MFLPFFDDRLTDRSKKFVYAITTLRSHCLHGRVVNWMRPAPPYLFVAHSEQF